MSETPQLIRQRLALLEPVQIELLDESAKHEGHAGARQGGGHYKLTITSVRFSGLTRIARHRLVFDALGDLMNSRIHALSIDARTPDEL